MRQEGEEKEEEERHEEEEEEEEEEGWLQQRKRERACRPPASIRIKENGMTDHFACHPPVTDCN